MRPSPTLRRTTLALLVAACLPACVPGELDDEDPIEEAAESGLSATEGTVLPPEADTFVQSGSYASTSFGAKTSVAADGDSVKIGYIRFRIGSVGAIARARLRVYVTLDSTNAADLVRISSTGWSESATTWNNKPAIDGAVVGSIVAAKLGAWVEVDVTSAVAADQVLSLAVRPRSNDSFAFSSKEAAANRPQLVLDLATTTPEPPPNPPAPTTASCLSGSGPLVTLSGAQSGAYDKRDDFAASTRIDARTASWTGTTLVPVRVGDGDGICWSGAKIQGTWDPFTTSWSQYHDTYAFTIFGNELTVENLRVDNYGDAVNVRTDVGFGDRFVARGLHVTNNHDDCFQNDGMKNGTIEQSLFDGCYVFYSSRGYGSGPTNVVTIRNNLVRLQAFPTFYGGSAVDPADWEHGGFWKIDEFDKAPKLEIHDNVFRADQDSRSWIPLMPDARSIAHASNNVVVWLGPGAFPERLPPGFTVTTDKKVWDDAVAAWKAAHPAP